MFFMQRLTATPGFRTVAVVAQIACRFDKARGFAGMAAGTQQFAGSAGISRMPGVHIGHCRGIRRMTQGTAGDLCRPSMISQFAEGEHLGAVNCLAVGIVTLGTGRGLGLWINAVGDQHLGIGPHHGVGARQEPLVSHASALKRQDHSAGDHGHVHDRRF